MTWAAPSVLLLQSGQQGAGIGQGNVGKQGRFAAPRVANNHQAAVTVEGGGDVQVA
jgi:hypothetical protein